MTRLVAVISLLTFSFNANAEWGQSWGSMVWGQSSTNIPMMGNAAQIIFFALLLCIGLIASRHWGVIRSLPAIALLALMPLIADADPLELNVFENGQVADADAINENFQTIATAIDGSDCASTTQLSQIENKIDTLQESGSCSQFDITVYDQGKIDGANDVDITTDNSALCLNAGGIYQAAGDTCSVDITTDNSALCLNAGGIYQAAADTCSVDITADNPSCDWAIYSWNGSSCVLSNTTTPTDICGDAIKYQCNGDASLIEAAEAAGYTFDANENPDLFYWGQYARVNTALRTYCSDGQTNFIPGINPQAETCGSCANTLDANSGFGELVLNSSGEGICQDVNECAVDNLGQNICGTADIYHCENNPYNPAQCTPLNCNSSCGGATPFCITDETADTQTCATDRVIVKHKYGGWIWLQHENGSEYLRGGFTQICGMSSTNMNTPNANNYGGTTQIYIGDSSGFVIGQNYPINTDANAPGCP